MKKLIFIIPLVILLSGCVNNVEPTKQEPQESTSFAETLPTVSASNQTEHRSQAKSLEDLPKDYPSQTAIANGDYVNVHGEISNKEVMDDFIHKVSNKENAFVRTTQYTVEGDPIITDINYENFSFLVKLDASRDAFGGASSKEITTKTYKNLLTYQDNEILFYFITNLDKISDEDYINGFDCVVLKFDNTIK